MPDQHFTVSLKDRLRLPLCPPGATCQHRAGDGTLCGEPLDSRGRHSKTCGVGKSRTARHNAMRDVTADFHSKVSGYTTAVEQRVTAWDRVNSRTGLIEEARLDVATRDAASGRRIFVDACVTCANSGYGLHQQARAGKDGVAAADAVRGSGLATRLLGVSSCHLSSRLAEGRLTRLWRLCAPGGWTWTRPSGLG